MRNVFAFASFFFAVTIAAAQTQVNPLQINWSAVTGSGAPSLYCPTTTTGTTATGSKTITLNNFTSVLVNQTVVGTGITSGSTVVAVSVPAGTVTLSLAATANGTVSLSFYSYGLPYTDVTNNVQYSCSAGGWIKSIASNGTVNAGAAGQVAYYAANGTAVSGESTVPATAGGTGTAALTGLRYANTGNPDTAASTSQIQTAIGSGVYDVSGAAATAQSNAEAYAANASNLSSGTVNASRLPVGIPIANVGSAGLSGTSPIQVASTGAISCPTCSTGSGTPSGPAGGDLSGTYPNPVVAQVNGAAVPTSRTVVGTNSGGQFVDASSATLANNTTGTAANVTGTVAPLNGGTGEAGTFSGLRQANNTSADTAATSTQVQAAIGSGVYDASGAAATAQSNAEAYAANASNLSSGTVNVARLPLGIPTASVGSSGLSGTTPIQVSASGAVSCPTCNTSSAAVVQVSNSDGSLSVTPTTGNVVASLNTAHANTWTATQTLPNNSITNAELANSTTTVNSVPCTLGSTCTVTVPVGGPAGGDLSGTYPNPTVAQVNGAVVPVSKTVVGTNSSGQIVDASSATLANNTTGTAANVTGVVALAKGGTGQNTLPAAFNALAADGGTAGETLYGPPQPSGFNSVTCLGDSLSVFPTSYCSDLSTLSGKTAYVLAIGGQRSGDIAVRVNAYAGQSQQTFGAGFTIPTSGSVTVTWGNANYNPTYNFTSGTSGVYTSGVEISTVVGGTTYQMNCYNTSASANTATCTPVAYPGSTVSVPNGNQWLAVLNPAWTAGTMLIRAGRNNFYSCSATPVTAANCSVLADIAAIVAKYPNYRVINFPNGDYYGVEYKGSSGYATLMNVNAALAATYGAGYMVQAYPSLAPPFYGGTFVDARAQSVYKTCQQASGTADLTYFCPNDVPGISMRATDFSGTLTEAITTTTQQAYTTSAQSGSTTIVGTEYIENQAPAGGGTSMTQVVRGFNSTTAATHLNGASFSGIDPAHENDNPGFGYNLDAQLVNTSLGSGPNPYMTLADMTSQNYCQGNSNCTLNELSFTNGNGGYLTSQGLGNHGLQGVGISNYYFGGVGSSPTANLGDGTYFGAAAAYFSDRAQAPAFKTTSDGTNAGTLGWIMSYLGLQAPDSTSLISEAGDGSLVWPGNIIPQSSSSTSNLGETGYPWNALFISNGVYFPSGPSITKSGDGNFQINKTLYFSPSGGSQNIGQSTGYSPGTVFTYNGLTGQGSVYGSIVGYPTSGGQTSHQVIGTCGAGTFFQPCSLTAGDLPSGVATQWTTSGSSIYYTGGNVGIGTTSPAYKFTVENDSAANDSTYSIGALRAGTDATLGPLNLIWELHPSATAGNRFASIYAGDSVAFRNLALQAYGGNVGIGTTSPTQLLSLKSNGSPLIGIQTNSAGSIASPLQYAGINAYDYSNSLAGSASFQDMSSSTNGTGYQISLRNQSGTVVPILSVNYLGNVGIGATSPGAPLETAATAQSAPTALLHQTGNDTAYGLEFKTDDSNAGERNWAIIPSNNNYGDFSIQYSNAKGGNPYSAGTTAMTILNSGNVGIGTTSPLALLNVDGASVNVAPSTGATPNGGFILTDVAYTSSALTMGTNGGYGSWIQPRSTTGAAYFNLMLNPNGGDVCVGQIICTHTLDVAGTVNVIGATTVASPITSTSNQIGTSAALVAFGNTGNGYGANAVLTGFSSSYPAALGATGSSARSFLSANAYLGAAASDTMYSGLTSFSPGQIFVDLVNNEFCYQWSNKSGNTANAAITNWTSPFCVHGDTGNGGVSGTWSATGYSETLTTPASSSATCTAGQFTDDANYHYVCTATNTWKRVALSTF